MQFLPCLLGAPDMEALDLSVRAQPPRGCSTGEAIWGCYGILAEPVLHSKYAAHEAI